MRETPISICERTFLIKALNENLRLDGRKNDEFRRVNISFGNDWGSVIACMGQTKVLAQVSCEIGEPKQTRPNEGIIYINVELGPMAAPHFEAGRNTDLVVQITRTLERAFIESRSVDLESLCIIAETRVWVLRVDLNVLNHDGNIIDCCSIATLSALAHFKRPDFTVTDKEISIHTAAEKEFIPIVLHHYPICISFCTFDEGSIVVNDPTAFEERIADSKMVFGLNSFRELCCLNFGGKATTSCEQVLKCVSRGATQAKKIVAFIKKTILEDEEARLTGDTNFLDCVRNKQILNVGVDRLTLKLRNFTLKALQDDDHNEEMPIKVEFENQIESTSLDNQMEDDNPRWIPETPDDEDDNYVVNLDESDGSNSD